jgi:hypothetical protein
MSNIPKDWQNVARSVRGVAKGDRISVQVSGGFVHKEAPCSGLEVTMGQGADESSVFLPNDKIPEVWPEDAPEAEDDEATE